MRALVTGAAGQLGVELLRTAPSHFEVVGVARGECDITNAVQLEETIEHHRPDVVINTAAYTGVDQAESNSDVANAVNATGAGNVARAAQRLGARIIHISSDYVFDGTSREPYRPQSEPNPINVYGASKLAGEREVKRAASAPLILRSSWLYAPHGKNFLMTILSALRASRPLQVVNDQIGVPTSARSLALTIWKCAERPELRGIHHWVDGGTASWYDFAVVIQDIALEKRLVGKPTPITAVTSEEYKLPARRPAYSVLDTQSLSGMIEAKPRPWRDWVAEMINELR